MIESNLSEFGVLLIFILGALLFAVVGLLASRFIRPNRPNFEKLTTYESGEDTVGSAWGQFNLRFYIVALIFILFEVEIIYLFPWALVFGDEALVRGTDWQWAWFAMTEMFIFIGVLALGLAYAWRKGYLDWVRPPQKAASFKSKIPAEAYKKYL
ncbi:MULTISPECIES: NADH-quinone oxidoreductase subunit A [Roseivirga]|uniref:NADH-quinone oxidoreductase subunit A n=1 Tax=Roseivirga TaxID=290180 RepID=UPI00257F3C46|nr:MULTISPECIES: NADH-quinone oxidoreductase subunit A [Roseivirga]MEC7755715.1 NADH-quinone oxidoreductase subunit A [Bacteroidota bacterium]|tara:strand:+ start:2929 stop:3393 length:465 start_codon:yes stop_codon:yes gene_type:complete